MKRSVPLIAQAAIWVAINLSMIAILFVLLLGRNGLGWNVLLSEPVRDRLLVIATELMHESAAANAAGQQAILDRYAEKYGGKFSIAIALGPDGFHDHGPPDDFDEGDGPPSLSSGLFDAPPAKPPPFPAHPGNPPAGKGREDAASLIKLTQVRATGEFQLSIPASLQSASSGPLPADVTVVFDRLATLVQFLGITNWLLFPILIMLLSALLWWPFMWSISHTISRVTEATRRIAKGGFDMRVATRRRDELGRLAESVNSMAERLQNHQVSQKQFLVDVAHEITSPLARMQIGLGILEPNVDPRFRRIFDDVRDDIEQMSEMLSELLLFSKAGMEAEQIRLEPVDVAAVAQAALAYEDQFDRVQLRVAAAATALASRSMVLRAVSNLVRNSLRYAGEQGDPIEIIVELSAATVIIRVRDRGPGVPAAALPRLGEPFFRPQLSRSRDSGGSGLGLAIVRRCIDACSGEVSFRNRDGGGFEAAIRLERWIDGDEIVPQS